MQRKSKLKSKVNKAKFGSINVSSYIRPGL